MALCSAQHLASAGAMMLLDMLTWIAAIFRCLLQGASTDPVFAEAAAAAAASASSSLWLADSSLAASSGGAPNVLQPLLERLMSASYGMTKGELQAALAQICVMLGRGPMLADSMARTARYVLYCFVCRMTCQGNDKQQQAASKRSGP